MNVMQASFDAQPNYITNINFPGEGGQNYSIPELPIPIHCFKLDGGDVFLDKKPPYVTPATSYRRGSSAPYLPHSEPTQDVPSQNQPIFPNQYPMPYRHFSELPNTPQENEHPYAATLLGHYDSIRTRGDSPETLEGLMSYLNIIENGPLAIPKECYNICPNQAPELTCVISTHLANGLDFNSISTSSQVLLKCMQPFHNISLRLTDEIIFGRRLSDVHVLMREPHVSGQQFILKFRIQSDGYYLIILNHGNQTIKLSCASGEYILKRGLCYVFNSGDEVWLTINGIEEVWWHITVNGTIKDVEKHTSLSFQNIFFNPYWYKRALQPQEYNQHKLLPGESHN